MPNRIVRDGFLDSEAINALGDTAECFYHRLLLAADDAGRMDGRVEMLRARLFPLSSRRASDVEKQLSDCIKQGLVIPYEWQGKPFVQLAKWQRCSPCVNSKFPWKDGSHRITYVKRETRDGEKEFVLTSLSHADAITKASDPLSHECPETLTLTETKTETIARKRAEFPCPADWIPAEAWDAYVEHRKAKRAKLTDKAVELILKELEEHREKGVAPQTVLEFAIKNGHTGLFYKPDQKAQAKTFAPAKYRCSRCGDGCGNSMKHKENIYCQSCYSKLKEDERGAELIARNIAAAARTA